MQLSHRTSKHMLNVYFEWICVHLMRSYDCKVWIEDAQSPHVDMVKILDYMRSNYKDSSIEEIEQKFSYSKNYLCKIIKNIQEKHMES
ncbi:hypothetical protein [Clostridium magnum]|nr:hypothetical protein [Clostridium magnum]